MPQIEISQRLYDYLAERASQGHDGNIHAFLYSYFKIHSIANANKDKTILELLERSEYKYDFRDAKDRYLIILAKLYKINSSLFATLNNFRMPNGERIVISTNRSEIESKTASDAIVLIPGTDFWCLVGLTKNHYQDLIFHMMRDVLYYPMPIALKVKQSIKDKPVSIAEFL